MSHADKQHADEITGRTRLAEDAHMRALKAEGAADFAVAWVKRLRILAALVVSLVGAGAIAVTSWQKVAKAESVKSLGELQEKLESRVMRVEMEVDMHRTAIERMEETMNKRFDHMEGMIFNIAERVGAPLPPATPTRKDRGK